MSSVKVSKAEKSPEARDRDAPKPVNVFYVWYTELCRRAGTQPLNYVKPAKPKNENVLDFVADRIRPEEWNLVLAALRRDTSLHVIAVRSRVKCAFLDEIDTKDKLKTLKRRAGSLHTAYICRALMKAITTCVIQSQVLSSLELDGIPIGMSELEVLVAALEHNHVIKILTFRNINIGNIGCQIICTALKQMPNIEVLNMTACKLDVVSAQSIAKVVKTQQINRYCESWHNSLRYETPEVEFMAGLRRITLNNNPGIGNDGVNAILDELDDDLWIKALDMQRCGVSELVGQRLLDVIEYSRSLEIADFRHNQLEASTLDRIFDLLKEKRSFSSVSEFKWCYTTTSLNSSAIPESQSRTSVFYPAGKSKSVPAKNVPSLAPSGTNTQFRRTKTSAGMASISECTTPNLTTIDSAKRPEFQRSLTSLHSRLQRETGKRTRLEQENRKLKEELQRLRSTLISVESKVSIPKERTIQYNPLPQKKISSKSKAKKEGPLHADHTIKPALNVEFIFEGTTPENDSSYDIVQEIVQDQIHDYPPPEVSKEIEAYFLDTVLDCKGLLDETTEASEDSDCASDVGSQASLLNYMREIKNSEP